MHDDDPATAGMRVEARVFLGIGAFVAVITVVYALAAYEEAGTVMLLLAAVMGFTIGGYLTVQARRRSDPAGGEEASPVESAYLPHASVWPFALGMGTVLVANGLALGAWATLPGAALVAASMAGYVRQSRRRD